MSNNGKKNSRKKGDSGEEFVAEYLKALGYVVEIHPRTFRRIHIKGKEIYVSQDNDYHNCFDIKAEGLEKMIYAQVKVESEKAHSSTAQAHIDRSYPFTFPYVRVQVWMVWKEWVSKPRRHKEFRFRIWERQGYEEKIIKGIHKVVGVWNEITPDTMTNEEDAITYQYPPLSPYENTMPPPAYAQINSKSKANKNGKVKKR